MLKIVIPILIGIGVALAIWGLIVLKNHSEENNQQDIASEIQDVSPVYELTSTQLEEEYDADQAAAEQKFKGEVVLISGLIHDFRESASPPVMTFTSDGFVWDVRCRMPDSQAETISSIIKDNRAPDQGTPRQPHHLIALVRVRMKGRVGSHKSLIFIELDGRTFDQILR